MESDVEARYARLERNACRTGAVVDMVCAMILAPAWSALIFVVAAIAFAWAACR